jgi:hypothetical protein
MVLLGKPGGPRGSSQTGVHITVETGFGGRRERHSFTSRAGVLDKSDRGGRLYIGPSSVVFETATLDTEIHPFPRTFGNTTTGSPPHVFPISAFFERPQSFEKS